MSAPRIILASLPSFCQKLSKLVEIWRSSEKNNFAQFFFETRCRQENLSLVSAALLADTLLSSVILYRQHTHRLTAEAHTCSRIFINSSRWVIHSSYDLLHDDTLTLSKQTYTHSTAVFTPVRSTFTQCLVFISNTETLSTVKNRNENNARPLYARQAGWA